MPDLIIIADDLTGALDTAAGFAAAGWKTLAAVDPRGLSGAAGVWVVSTESRHMPPEQAAQRVVAAWQALAGRLTPAENPAPGTPERSFAGFQIYKKMDSTLRGNPAFELRALLQAAGHDRALVCPAFPAQGRTVQGGRAYWNGQPLEQTEFGAQIPTASLAELFQPLADLFPLYPAGTSRAPQTSGAGVWLADAATDAQLDQCVEDARRAGIAVLCGSAGLANALLRSSSAARDQAQPALPHRLVGPVLVVAGSRSAVTARQVAFLEQAGMPVLTPPLEYLATGASRLLLDWLAGVNTDRQDSVLSACSTPSLPLPAQLIAARLAQAAQELTHRLQPGGWVLTGGDTAAAVCTALGAGVLELHGAPMPGTAWGSLADGPFAGRQVITRAGGFGGPDNLLQAVRFLRGAAQPP